MVIYDMENKQLANETFIKMNREEKKEWSDFIQNFTHFTRECKH